MKTKKTVTAAKLAANRDNAQASTGPKSSLGKRYSSRNSTSHGVFAYDRLLPGESNPDGSIPNLPSIGR